MNMLASPWAPEIPVTNSRTFYGSTNIVDEIDSTYAKKGELNQPVEPGENLLRSTWTQWHLDSRLVRRGDDQSWKEAQLRVKYFETVEGFFRIRNYIKEPSQLLPDSGYSVFRRGAWPGWEDRTCRGLLRYSCQMPSSHLSRDSTPLLVDQLWLHMVLHMIGEDTFGDATNFICGAMVTNKKHGSYRFEYWLNVKDQQSLQQIEPGMKKLIYDVHQAEPENLRKRTVNMNEIKIDFQPPPKRNY